MRESMSPTRIYDFPVQGSLPFLSTPTRPAIIRFGNEVKFSDRDSLLHHNNINRDSGIEIPEAWMPTIKKHNRRMVQQLTTEGPTSLRNSEDQNTPSEADQHDINGAA